MSIPHDAIGRLWHEAITGARRLAKADRARELRGDKRSPLLDARGLHPFSVEWGRVLALEQLNPDLEQLRTDEEPPVDHLSIRAHAYREAEADFAAELAERGAGEVFAQW